MLRTHVTLVESLDLSPVVWEGSSANFVSISQLPMFCGSDLQNSYISYRDFEDPGLPMVLYLNMAYNPLSLRFPDDEFYGRPYTLCGINCETTLGSRWISCILPRPYGVCYATQNLLVFSFNLSRLAS